MPTWIVTITIPIDTPAPDIPTATGVQDSNYHPGPGTAYDVLGYLLTGQTIPIVGCLSSNSWWGVQLPAVSKPCWIWDTGVSVTGPINLVLVVTPLQNLLRKRYTNCNKETCLSSLS